MTAKFWSVLWRAWRCRKVFDEVPLLVEFPVQGERLNPSWMLGNHDFRATLVEVGDDVIAVEGLVGDQSAKADALDQRGH